MTIKVGVAGLAIMLVATSWGELRSQDRRPHWPGAPQERGMTSAGLPVSPFFEGWYENPDGTYTLSFGYFNRNKEEALLLPVGENNSLWPEEYDGLQPTAFAPGRGTGVFTVTVPEDFARNDGRVVWTVRSHAVPHAVPGKAGVEAYRLHYGPMAMGSLPPMLKLREGGPELWGPMTLAGDARELSTWSERENVVGSIENQLRLMGSVGTPLRLTVWVADRVAPAAEREPQRGGITWFTHQGPAFVVFSAERQEPDSGTGGRKTVTATFSQPGRYVLRVRADNFNPVDSTPADQCCWTNGYVAVIVSL